GHRSSLHTFCGSGFENGVATNLFHVLGQTPPRVPTLPVRTLRNINARATCQPPRFPLAALRHTCEANAEPARAISCATSTIVDASTPHSSAANSGVKLEYTCLSSSMKDSNEDGRCGRSKRMNSSQFTQRRTNWRSKRFSFRMTEAIESSNAASVPGYGDNQ